MFLIVMDFIYSSIHFQLINVQLQLILFCENRSHQGNYGSLSIWQWPHPSHIDLLHEKKIATFVVWGVFLFHFETWQTALLYSELEMQLSLPAAPPHLPRTHLLPTTYSQIILFYATERSFHSKPLKFLSSMRWEEEICCRRL